MPIIARSVDIRVPAEQAFEFMAEINNFSKFSEGISDLHVLSEKDRGVGVTFAGTVDRPHKGPQQCEFVITDFVDYIDITFHATKGCEAEGIWHFSRMAGLNAKTRITYTFNYKVQVPIVGSLIDLLFVRRIWKQRVEQTLQNLKDVLENEYEMMIS